MNGDGDMLEWMFSQKKIIVQKNSIFYEEIFIYIIVGVLHLILMFFIKLRCIQLIHVSTH